MVSVLLAYRVLYSTLCGIRDDFLSENSEKKREMGRDCMKLNEFGNQRKKRKRKETVQERWAPRGMPVFLRLKGGAYV